MDICVQACRVLTRKIRLALNLRCDAEPIAVKWLILHCQEKPLGSTSGSRTKTDTGRQVENTKAIE